MQRGWVPPDKLSEADYAQLKLKKDPSDPGCSFSGKYFRGYARGAETRNYAYGAKQSLLKKLDKCKDVEFTCCDYRAWHPHNSW